MRLAVLLIRSPLKGLRIGTVVEREAPEALAV